MEGVASEKLQRLVQIANVISPDCAVAPFFDEMPEEVEEAIKKAGVGDTDWTRRLTVMMDYRLKELPKSFRQYVWQGGTVQSAVRLYENFRVARTNLRSIARTAVLPHSKREEFVLEHPLGSDPYIVINAQGVLELTRDHFAEAVEGIEARRIKECAICERIFFAFRKDQKCCMKGCSNTYRVRKFREKSVDEKAKHKYRQYKRYAKRDAISRR